MSEPTDNNDDNKEGLLQQAVYSGPSLKMPLPAGYKWKLTTKVNDPGDHFHTDDYNGYWSLDFTHRVQDVTQPGTVQVDVDSSSDGGKIDVLAAAGGNVLFVKNDNCSNGGIACKVIINHGNGYYTSYLHFQNGSIIVSVGDPVAQGQVLGKMGSTGISTGVHLHFQVYYSENSTLNNDKLLNGQSYSTTTQLQGLMLEGKLFTEYTDTTAGFYPSTNGFAYNPAKSYGPNPRTCSDGLVLDSGSNTYTCTAKSRFNLNRNVFSDVLIENVKEDVCLKAEVWMGSASSPNYTSPEYCTSGFSPSNPFNLYFTSLYPTTIVGSGKIKYYITPKRDLWYGPIHLPEVYLSAPFAVAPFLVLSGTPTNQPAPVINSPADWTIVPASSAGLWWTDAASWIVEDHDLNVWAFNGNIWQDLGWLYGLVGQNALVGVSNGLPAYRWLAWRVRTCGPTGCSNSSSFAYFALSP